MWWDGDLAFGEGLGRWEMGKLGAGRGGGGVEFRRHEESRGRSSVVGRLDPYR